MGIYVQISFISIISLFFLVLNHDFISYTDFTISQLQTQKLMTSQIRSHIEYLIQTYNILLLSLHSKIDEMKNVASLTVFSMIQ